MSEAAKAKPVTKVVQVKEVVSSVVNETSQGEHSDTLLNTISEMAGSLGIMNEIIQKANFISVSASIEAARTQNQSENFSLVADQVMRQSEKTQEMASDLKREIDELEKSAMMATSVRYADIASDLIDKIDRNLFERNCDCQAWAGFDEIKKVVLLSKDLEAISIKEAIEGEALTVSSFGDSVAEPSQADLDNPDFDPLAMINVENKGPEILGSIQSASSVLEKLCKAYQVYIDVLVLNNLGVVVAVANNSNLLGKDMDGDEAFKEVMENGVPYVSDMHKSPSAGNRYTVSYSAPIKNSNGDLLGVLSTRFNWDYVQEMLQSMPVDAEAKLFVINNEGTLIAKKPKGGLLADNLSWLNAGETAIEGGTGYSIECARNGQLSAWGFCHTYGFGAYPGKGWSAVVNYPIESKNNKFFLQNIKRDPVSKRQAADTANQTLEKVAGNVSEVVERINAINNETNMLAVNAAIQAGVAGAEGESFSVIASEIGKLSKQSEDFVASINLLTDNLGKTVSQTIYKRLGEAAFDTIDKIDRNLFERYCDIQAFSSFSVIKNFLAGSSVEVKEIQTLLKSLHDIYEVYHDVFLLNTDGEIVAAAKHRDLEGTNQSDRDWFREAMTGKIVVTDLHKSKSIDDYTVTFASPVAGENGKTLGVITTRFNCKFIYDIMAATIVGKDSNVFLVNAKGTVIGATTNANILQDSMAHSAAYKAVETRSHGYETEVEKDGRVKAAGFAKTKGYLTYKGKGWSVIIER